MISAGGNKVKILTYDGVPFRTPKRMKGSWAILTTTA